MPLVVPNIESNPAFNGQAVADSTDWAILTAAAAGTGTVSGGQVTQDTGTDMKVAVSAWTGYVGGVEYTQAATGGSPLTIAAASTTDRRDLVVFTVGTGFVVVQGTPCGTANYPVKPAIPANSAALGEVYVASTTTAITTASNIVDKSCLITDAEAVNFLSGSNATATVWGTATTLITTGTLTAGVWEVIASVAYGLNTGSTVRAGTISSAVASGTATIEANSTLASAPVLSGAATGVTGEQTTTVLGTVTVPAGDTATINIEGTQAAADITNISVNYTAKKVQ